MKEIQDGLTIQHRLTEAERAEQKLKKEQEREAKRLQREQERQKKIVQQEQEREAKRLQREQERQQKTTQRIKENKTIVPNINFSLRKGESTGNTHNFSKLHQQLDLLNLSLKKLATQTDCQDIIQPILETIANNKNDKTIQIEVVLLTEKQHNPKLSPFFDWIDMKTNPTELFQKKQVQLTKKNNQNIAINVYHIDNQYTVNENRSTPTIKIFVYDDWFVKNHSIEKKLLELTIDMPSVMLISLEEKQGILPVLKKKIALNCYNVEDYSISNLPEEKFKNSLLKEDYQQKIECIRLFQELKSIIKVAHVIEYYLQNQQVTLDSNNILTEKQKIQYISKKTDLTSKDLNTLKTEIIRSFKTLAKHIEQDIEQVDLEDETALLKKLKNKVDNLTNIREIEGTKYSNLEISEGFLLDMKQQVYRRLVNAFEENKKTINARIQDIKINAKKSVDNLGGKAPVFKDLPMAEEITHDILKQNLVYTKDYQKQITKKGWYHLLMEVRTPLFMVMPLMMVAGILVVLAQQDDVGTISDEALRNGRNCVTITQLPVKYENPDNFIKTLSAPIIIKATTGRDRGETFHDSDGVCHLGLKKVSVKGKRSKETRLDIEKDLDSGKMYLFLSKSGNRAWVIERLKNPDNKLIVIPAEGGGGGGLGAIARFFSKAGPYKPLILVTIIVLLWWFIKKKQKEFDKEKVELKSREVKNLKTSLKQEMEKMVRSSSSRWRNKVMDYLGEQQTTIQLTVDEQLQLAMQEHNGAISEKMSIIDLRFSNFKNQQKQLVNQQKELQRYLDALNQMKVQFRKAFV